MTTLRTLLAALLGSMARDEGQAARAESYEKVTVFVPKPPRYFRDTQSHAPRDPLADLQPQRKELS